MRYLLLLMLAGCVQTTWKQEVQSPPGPRTAMSWSPDHKIGYSCQQQDVNQALVWVECDFHNFSARTDDICIEVVYRQGKREIARSRPLCGIILAQEVDTNYAAFNKERRQALTVCGPKLEMCTLTTENAQNTQ